MNSRSPSARSETKASAVRACAVNRSGADVDPGLGQGLRQEMPERVVADLAHEGARQAQPGEPDRDVGRRAARRLLERRGIDQAGAGDGRHEVDQQLTEADDVRHVAPLSFYSLTDARARRSMTRTAAASGPGAIAPVMIATASDIE